MPLVDGVDFFSELERAIRETIPRPKMMILGFPSNPTAQCVELDFFERVVALAKQYNVLVIHDLAYADIVYDGWKAPSIMQVPGAKDIAVEFFTLSKSYNMAGWRIGFMVGNPELVSALARIKSYHDYGTFTPLQVAAIAALEGDQQCVRDIAEQYRQRRNVLVKGLHEAGWMVENPSVDVRVGENSRALCPPRFAGVRQAPAGGSQGLRLAGHRLRRLRRYSRALRADRESGSYPPGGARHQGDVPRGRAAEARQSRQRQITLSGRAFARPYFFRPKVFFIISPLCSTTLNFIFWTECMSNRYARSQIVLHWLTLLMVILTYAAMLLKDSVPEAWAPMVKNLHFNFGVSVFALMLIRLAVRSFHAAPPTTPPLEEWQEVGAKIFHWLLYVVFLMLPLLGMLTLPTAGNRGLCWVGRCRSG